MQRQDWGTQDLYTMIKLNLWDGTSFSQLKLGDKFPSNLLKFIFLHYKHRFACELFPHLGQSLVSAAQFGHCWLMCGGIMSGSWPATDQCFTYNFKTKQVKVRSSLLQRELLGQLIRLAPENNALALGGLESWFGRPLRTAEKFDWNESSWSDLRYYGPSRCHFDIVPVYRTF